MKTYIAGPMTGLPEFNRPAFNAAAKEIAASGHVPLNPAILPDGLSQYPRAYRHCHNPNSGVAELYPHPVS